LDLSTPSLGITTETERAISWALGNCFQLPLSGSRVGSPGSEPRRRSSTFNSLSRDHSFAVILPRSFGVLGLFQLPLSGSPTTSVAVPTTTTVPTFNSLSRDHEGHLGGSLRGRTGFQLPLSGSLDVTITRLRRSGLTFNSLSRDHGI